MPSTGDIYQKIVQNPLDTIVKEIKVGCLIKLVPKGHPTGLMFGSPEWESKSPAEKKSAQSYWNNTGKGLSPEEKYFTTTWMPQLLTLEDGSSPIIKNSFTPIRFMLPVSENEKYSDLKDRVEKESVREVIHTREEAQIPINAYYFGNLKSNYLIGKEAVRASWIAAVEEKEKVVARITFDLCFYEIELEGLNEP